MRLKTYFKDTKTLYTYYTATYDTWEYSEERFRRVITTPENPGRLKGVGDFCFRGFSTDGTKRLLAIAIGPEWDTNVFIDEEGVICPSSNVS